MPFLNCLMPFATSPIMFEKRPPPSTKIASTPKISQWIGLPKPITNLPYAFAYLVLFGLVFHCLIRLAVQAHAFHREIHRIEQARSAQILDSGQIAPAFQPEMGQE